MKNLIKVCYKKAVALVVDIPVIIVKENSMDNDGRQIKINKQSMFNLSKEREEKEYQSFILNAEKHIKARASGGHYSCFVLLNKFGLTVKQESRFFTHFKQLGFNIEHYHEMNTQDYWNKYYIISWEGN